MSCDVGLYGLAVMGQNFALNMAEHGFKVSVCNRSPSKVDTTVARAKDEGDLPLEGHKGVKEFIASMLVAHKLGRVREESEKTQDKSESRQRIVGPARDTGRPPNLGVAYFQGSGQDYDVSVKQPLIILLQDSFLCIKLV